MISRDEEGYIYAIECEGAIKIGFSVRPVARLQGLKGSSPFEYRLIGMFIGFRTDEEELHERFEAYRIRYEWYRNEGEVAEFVRSLPSFVLKEYRKADNKKSGAERDAALYALYPKPSLIISDA